MKAILAFVFVVFSSSSLALQLGPSPAGAPIPIPPPKPVPDAKFPHWGYWKPIYDNGTSVSNEYLRGEWILTANASTPDCKFVMGKDTSNPKGIKNADGTYLASPIFDDFPTDGGSIFGVKVRNFTSKKFSQGPYELAPQEPQFATWSYKYEEMSSESFFEFNCRGTDKGELICGLNLHGTTDCANSPLGVFLVYAKKPVKK